MMLEQYNVQYFYLMFIKRLEVFMITQHDTILHSCITAII